MNIDNFPFDEFKNTKGARKLMKKIAAHVYAKNEHSNRYDMCESIKEIIDIYQNLNQLGEFCKPINVYPLESNKIVITYLDTYMGIERKMMVHL